MTKAYAFRGITTVFGKHEVACSIDIVRSQRDVGIVWGQQTYICQVSPHGLEHSVRFE